MKLFKLIGILALINNLYALNDGFDFGSVGDCSGGNGNFKQSIENYGGDYEKVVKVGDIPIGLKDLKISLTSDKDVDIRLYAENGTKIIHWPYGQLNGANKKSTTYNGVTIEYSGYNGVNGKLGNEYIIISGTTKNSFEMKAFGYKAGFAEVKYSWAGKEGCSSTPKDSGNGDFKQEIKHQSIIKVGDIPKGVNNLLIKLKSDKDLDIQLYDKADGQAIVKWSDNDKGILNGPKAEITNYKGMKIEWSGYNGDGTGKGNEYIEITGITSTELEMKAYGYEAGFADVHYEWGKKNSEQNTSDESCKVITNDSGYSDIFPNADIKWSATGTTVQSIEQAFNYARGKDTTISKKLIMPSQNDWDTMSVQEKALYLTNKERYDRGIKPFEGIDSNVVTIAQNYAQLLYDTGKFEHTADGTPWDRLDSVDLIKNNKDFFGFGENLATFAGSHSYRENPIAQSIYAWIYDDSGSAWGHRKFSLAVGLQDNSGESGAEGLIGFGIVQGENYGKYPNWKSVIVVMNAFDPSSSWNHSNTKKVSICSGSVTQPQTTPTNTTSNPQPINQKATLLKLVNDARKVARNCGDTYMKAVGEVTWNDKLEQSAISHSQDMNTNNFFSHTGSDGSSAGDRIKKMGYNWQTYGENIAMGQTTEQEVINGWLNSPGHCKNIMNGNFKEMGIAKKGSYWTQVFGKLW